jgi:hypothetical protein
MADDKNPPVLLSAYRPGSSRHNDIFLAMGTLVNVISLLAWLVRASVGTSRSKSSWKAWMMLG